MLVIFQPQKRQRNGGAAAGCSALLFISSLNFEEYFAVFCVQKADYKLGI